MTDEKGGGGVVEDGYEDGVLFDDTVVMDSPIEEGNLDADTEELDIDDGKVVLDSDDEGIQREETEDFGKELSSENIDRTLGGDGGRMKDGQLSPAAKRSYIGYFRRRGSKIRSCLTDIGSDSWRNSICLKQHNSRKVCEADRVEGQVTDHGFVKEGSHGKMSGGYNAKISEIIGEVKSGDVGQNISTGAVHAEKDLPSSSCEAMDGGKDTFLVSSDHKFASLSYIESQEPGDPSQANALAFVDHYLSTIGVNFSPEVERRKVTRIASPLTSFGKGSQALAKRANSRTSNRESRCFDWSSDKSDDMADLFSMKREDFVSGCKSLGQRSISKSQVDGNLNFKKEKGFGVQGVMQLQGILTNENHRDSTLMAVSCNETSDMVQTTVMKSNTTSIKELDEQRGEESFGQPLENSGTERDVAGMFDIGFDTQMAAEVMETLIHAPPPRRTACAQEHSGEGSPKDETMNIQPKCSSGCSGSGSEVTAKRSKRTMRPTNERKRNISCSSQLEENISKLVQESSVKKKGRRRMPVTDKENMNQVDGNHISGNSVNCDSHDKGTERRKFKTRSPIARRGRRHLSQCSPKSTEDPQNSSKERLNTVTNVNNTFKKSRKRSNSDVLQVLDVRKKCPKLSSDTTCEATKTNGDKLPQADPLVAATTSHLELHFWTFPKRKRTCRNVPQSLRQTNDTSPSVLSENHNTFSVKFHQNPEENSGATHLILHVKRKPRSARKLQPSSEKKQIQIFHRTSFGDPNKVDVSCNATLLDGQTGCIHSNDVKASCQSVKLDDSNLLSSTAGAGENLSFGELPNAKLIPLPDRRDAESCKPLLKKSSSRSPLMKELNRLGFSASIPEFAFKDLRKRRSMANIQVLFSQNLDDDIIKHQKKILARLGISVASCGSEATHFITDRFVRTRNMLEAIALGKPVVTHLWLEACAQANFVVDENKYILRDLKKEKEIGFSMSVSLARARQHPLLKGRRVFITKNVKPSKEMIENLVKAVHGQAVDHIQRDTTGNKLLQDDLLILSSEQDYATCSPFLEEGVAVYDSELLLNGIVTQKLDYVRHQIFRDCVKTKTKCNIVYSRRRKGITIPAS